jgi:serine/threonine-protein kinase
MQTPVIPPDEAKRLALLKACHILYTPAEEAFDEVARLAADLCGTEIALITLVDSDRQWFKARVGIERTEVPRDLSFCGHCINTPQPLVVEDALLDPRFADNPLVTGDPFIRFYAGVPLEVDEGSSIGALSVADRSPRRISPQQLSSLHRLARQIARELRLRRDLDAARAGGSLVHDGGSAGSADSAGSAPKPRAAASDVTKPASFPIQVGMTVGGRWRIARVLGAGGVGAVFEAHAPDGERAAIKVLLPEWRSHEHVLERFAREARVLMRLKSPHVARLLDVGNLDAAHGDLPYLVLEYLEGLDLDRLIGREGRQPFRRAFRWCADACEGVAEAHALGVVHRDLKPSNVFLAEAPGAPVTVKVLDFGIAAGEPAASGAPKLTKLDALLGSPAYMSPEQMVASHDVDPRSDVWSMGALLYEVITGQQPFRGDTELQVFAAAMTKPPLPLRAHLHDEELPAEVEEILLRCLRKKRTERYPSMRELAEALRAAARASGSAA